MLLLTAMVLVSKYYIFFNFIVADACLIGCSFYGADLRSAHLQVILKLNKMCIYEGRNDKTLAYDKFLNLVGIISLGLLLIVQYCVSAGLND